MPRKTSQWPRFCIQAQKWLVGLSCRSVHTLASHTVLMSLVVEQLLGPGQTCAPQVFGQSDPPMSSLLERVCLLARPFLHWGGFGGGYRPIGIFRGVFGPPKLGELLMEQRCGSLAQESLARSRTRKGPLQTPGVQLRGNSCESSN